MIIDHRLIILAEDDNIAVARMALRAGETVVIDGQPIVLCTDIPIGHKIAICPILSGEKVIKYRAPIGTARVNIPIGNHAHVHNIKSNYTPTYALQGQEVVL